jgi:hypothetical protein
VNTRIGIAKSKEKFMCKIIAKQSETRRQTGKERTRQSGNSCSKSES